MQLLKKSIIVLYQIFILIWGSIYLTITLLVPLNFLTLSGWIILFFPNISKFQDKIITLRGRKIKIKTIKIILLIAVCTITNLLYWNLTKQIFNNFGHPK